MGAQPLAHPSPGVADFQALGTGVIVQVADRTALADVRRRVEHELEAVDRACSRFREDSELSRVNAAGGRAIAVGELFCEALGVALRAAELTGGDVDPTIGRALELCGYDRDWSMLEAPVAGDETAAAQPVLRALARPGWRKVELDTARGLVRLPSGVRLDLGATAKAWAADRCATAGALVAGCPVLVGVGGDIATAAGAPAGGWRVRVTDDHRDDGSAPGQTIVIASGGVATSSTAVRRWRHRGLTMHHILDPASGMPARETWRTVSVAADSATDANIAATAAIVRARRATGWLAGLRLPARLVEWGGAVWTVAGWPAQAPEEAAA